MEVLRAGVEKYHYKYPTRILSIHGCARARNLSMLAWTTFSGGCSASSCGSSDQSSPPLNKRVSALQTQTLSFCTFPKYPS